jgi:hypothetical protein
VGVNNGGPASAGLSTLGYALSFARRGHAVLLLHGIIERNGKLSCTCGKDACDSPGKHPHHACPNGVHSATTDEEIIKGWFAKYPNANYGISTETLPTIDIDPRNGGREAWLNLIRQNYDVHTWRVVTGSGGEHIMFGATNKPLRSCKLARGIDFQAAGKYIVGVGCRHISGAQYRWAPQCSPKEAELMAAPQWVIDCLDAPTELDKRRPPEHWQKMIREGVDDGSRNDMAASLAGFMLRVGMSVRETYEFMLTWDERNRPPLGEERIGLTVESIAAKELRRRGI